MILQLLILSKLESILEIIELIDNRTNGRSNKEYLYGMRGDYRKMKLNWRKGKKK